MCEYSLISVCVCVCVYRCRFQKGVLHTFELKQDTLAKENKQKKEQSTTSCHASALQPTNSVNSRLS